MKFRHFAFLVVTMSVCSPQLLAAQSSPTMFDKKRDQRTPIEITADALEVLQEENRAIFSGHVVAVQGDLRLTANNMTVYYNPDANKAKNEKAKSTKNNAIDKIDALGNVLLATPDETASGKHGIYDVQKQNIRLTGDVKLTRGQNILEGDALVYSFATGKSKITSAAATAKSGSGKKSSKRVRALFVPAKDKK